MNRIHVMMVFATLFWAGAFITGKIAIHEFSAFSLTFFRFLFALPFIFLILIRMQPENRLPAKKQWLPLVTLGVIGTFSYHVLFFSSLKYTSAVNSSLIGSTLPLVTTIVAMMLVGEKVTLLRAAGIFLAFAGITMVVTDGNWYILRNLQFNPGDILMFAAVWSWAVYTVLSRLFMAKYNLTPIVVTTYTFLICTIAALPFVLWEIPAGFLPLISWGGWLAVIYMAIFASVLGYLMHLMAVQKIGASRAAIFVNLVPIFTIILSTLFLGETVSTFKLLSTCIIIFGVYLASRIKEEDSSVSSVVKS